MHSKLDISKVTFQTILIDLISGIFLQIYGVIEILQMSVNI